jgi:hypothetical protein
LDRTVGFGGKILRFSFLTFKAGVLIPGGVVARTRQVVLPANFIINYLAEQFGFQYTQVWPVPFGPSVNPTNFSFQNQFFCILVKISKIQAPEKSEIFHTFKGLKLQNHLMKLYSLKSALVLALNTSCKNTTWSSIS